MCEETFGGYRERFLGLVSFATNTIHTSDEHSRHDLAPHSMANGEQEAEFDVPLERVLVHIMHMLLTRIHKLQLFTSNTIHNRVVLPWSSWSNSVAQCDSHDHRHNS